MQTTDGKKNKTNSPLRRILAVLGLLVIFALITALIVVLLQGGDPGKLLIVFMCIIFVSVMTFAVTKTKQLMDESRKRQ